MGQSFKDLVVWQRSIELTVMFIGSLKVSGFRTLWLPQMRRASVSIASNIAEGYGRQQRENMFSFRARSRFISELETQLYRQKLGFGALPDLIQRVHCNDVAGSWA